MLRQQFLAGSLTLMAVVFVFVIYGTSQAQYDDLYSSTKVLVSLIQKNIRNQESNKEKELIHRMQNSAIIDQSKVLLSTEVKEQIPVKAVANQNIPRIAVICYLYKGDKTVRQFITMLYGAWQYVKDNMHQVEQTKDFHYIDLLAFCHPSVCRFIHSVCKEFKLGRNLKDIEMNCWAIEQSFEYTVTYGYINSFVMFNRTDIHDILKPYEKLLRSDGDGFLTPALLTWQPVRKIEFGQLGYCDPFNKKRLMEISAKLGMRHQGVHCIGSTWYGEKDIFIKISLKTIEMTVYMYLNEFDPKAPGLETVDFKSNREGEWPKWWRPVSLLYGGELAINHIIDNLSEGDMWKSDTPSCSKENYLSTPHIHALHNSCEFQKFKFMDQLNIAVGSRDTLPGDIVHRIIANMYPPKYGEMSVAEYSTYIAWSSVGKYLRRWFS